MYNDENVERKYVEKLDVMNTQVTVEIYSIDFKLWNWSLGTIRWIINICSKTTQIISNS
jgi:hypothetical protein